MRESEEIYRTAALVLIVGAIIFPIFFAAFDAIWGQYATSFPFSLEYFPAFFATSIGVFLALFLDSFLKKRGEEESMTGIQEIIENELQRAVNSLKKGKGNLIDIQVWDSLINSGRASLLPIDMQKLLFDIYADIRAHNFEAILTREDGDDFRSDPTEVKKLKWIQSSERLLGKERVLQERISSFLSMKLLSKKEVENEE